MAVESFKLQVAGAFFANYAESFRASSQYYKNFFIFIDTRAQ
jgi:hypothetical protein